MIFLRPSGPRNKTCDKDFPLEQHSPYNNGVVSSQHFIYLLQFIYAQKDPEFIFSTPTKMWNHKVSTKKCPSRALYNLVT